MSEALAAPAPRALRARPLSPCAGLAGVATLLACALAPSVARADYFDDVWHGAPVKVCPFFFGPGCRTSISLDLVVAYQPTTSDDNGHEEYTRVGVETALSHRVVGDLHLGPAVEFGSQDGQFMTGFHIVPKLRARYWAGGSPFSLDLSAGLYVGRAWLDTGDAGRNRLGLQMDTGLGVFGSLQLIGGFAVLTDPGGVYGLQTQTFIGVRASFLALAAGALFAIGSSGRR